MKRLRGRGKRFHSWSKSQAVAFNRCFTFFHSSFIDGSIAPSTAVGLAPFAGAPESPSKTRIGRAETGRSQITEGATGLVLPSTSIQPPQIMIRRSAARLFEWRRFYKNRPVWQSIWEALRRSSEDRIMKIEDILVPIDFSTGSLRALDYALAMVDPGGEVYLPHVIDADFLARVSGEGSRRFSSARRRRRRCAPRAFRSCACRPGRTMERISDSLRLIE